MNKLFLFTTYLLLASSILASCSGSSNETTELEDSTKNCTNKFCIETPPPFDVPTYDPSQDVVPLYVIKVDDRYGYINKDGEIVLEPQWDKAYPFKNGVANVWMPAGGVDQAYINKKGEYLWKEENSDAYTSNGFSEGLCSFGIHKNDKFRHGYVNQKGEEVIPPVFNSAWDFHDGMAHVVILDPPADGDEKYLLSDEEKKEREHHGFINTKGEVVVDFIYDDAFDFQNGFAVVIKGHDYYSKKEGLINTQGEEVLPVEYENVGFFSEGLCAVKKDGKYGYIDTAMNVVIDFQFDGADQFHGGYAPFSVPDPEDYGSLYGLINRKGEIVVPAVHDNMYYAGEGVWQVGVYNAYGLIDTTGKEIYPTTSTEMPIFDEGLAPVGVNGLVGFINTKGEMVIEPQWDDVMGFENGLCMVINGGMFWHAKAHTEFGYINKKGEYVWPMTR